MSCIENNDRTVVEDGALADQLKITTRLSSFAPFRWLASISTTGGVTDRGPAGLDVRLLGDPVDNAAPPVFVRPGRGGIGRSTDTTGLPILVAEAAQNPVDATQPHALSGGNIAQNVGSVLSLGSAQVQLAADTGYALHVRRVVTLRGTKLPHIGITCDVAVNVGASNGAQSNETIAFFHGGGGSATVELAPVTLAAGETYTMTAAVTARAEVDLGASQAVSGGVIELGLWGIEQTALVSA